MGRRTDILVPPGNSGLYTGAGTNYLVHANNGALYAVYIDESADVSFTKSTDGGLTWSAPTLIFTGTVVNLSIWYDRWSGLSSDLIHIAYTDSGVDDTLYRTIDTGSSDSLSTETTIFAGSTTAGSGHLSITRARGGNVYCKTIIDSGAEGGFFRLPNANVPNGAWDAARTIDETIGNQVTDQHILLPGFAADDQDILSVFWDASANEISRKIYDDSANSWAETSIATSMNDGLPSTAFPHFAATVDLANSRIIMAAWSAVDTLNADLRCWTITESAITETSTNVVLNSTDDQGFCAISLDVTTGMWRVVYAGKSDGSETFPSSLNLYMKTSTDGGATWSAETQISPRARQVRWLVTTPRSLDGRLPVYVMYPGPLYDALLACNVDIVRPRAALAIGV